MIIIGLETPTSCQSAKTTALGHTNLLRECSLIWKLMLKLTTGYMFEDIEEYFTQQRMDSSM